VHTKQEAQSTEGTAIFFKEDASNKYLWWSFCPSHEAITLAIKRLQKKLNAKT